MKTLMLAAIRCSLMFTAVTGSLISVQPAQAYTVTLQQVGHDVIATGSGGIDLTGLTFGSTSGPLNEAFLLADPRILLTGPTSLGLFDRY